MKIVQTFWTKPFFKKGAKTFLDRFAGGWTERKFNFMSLALSCLQLREFYDDIQLITDARGKDLLVDKLRLPYTDVRVELETLDNYHPDLWALAKIYAYSIQEEPFLHVDGDVFIWEKFDAQLERAPLASQALNIDFPIVRYALEEVFKHFDYIPPVIKKNWHAGDMAKSNAGVYGGNDISFFKDYTRTAFEFVNRNHRPHIFGKMHLGLFGIIYEEYLFYSLAKEKKIDVYYHLGQIEGEDPVQLADFKGVPGQTTYLHPLGTFKDFKEVGEEVAYRLRLDHPGYYYRILNLFDNYEI